MTPSVAVDIARLDQRTSDLDSKLQLVYIVLGILFAAGATVPFIPWFMTTRRESNLAITGERAAQGRAQQVHETFLTTSRDTLDLVNSTLQLAEAAGRRTAETIRQKANDARIAFDTDARALLEEVQGETEDRSLVSRPELRSRVRSIAARITGFESNQIYFPEEISLTPPAIYFRGIFAHLDQQFDDAFVAWDNVALDDIAKPELRASARYWSGYQYNNLGRFAEALHSFSLGLQHAGPERRLEFERIILETRFFAREHVEPIIVGLTELVERLESQEDTQTLSRASATLGNVLHATASERRAASDEEAALQLNARAASQFERVSEQSHWARFGLAEALYQLGDRRSEAVELFKDRVRPDAVREFDRRDELRTKFMARSAELVACLRVPELRERVGSVEGLVSDALGAVPEQVTVYSLVQRRNIRKTAAREELASLVTMPMSLDVRASA